MTEKEYANIKPGDVIFNMKNNKAQVVSVVNDGYVSWQEGGSTPKSHLLEWHYASLMRERSRPELTWKDLKKLWELRWAMPVTWEGTEEEWYKELLKRFNESKED